MKTIFMFSGQGSQYYKMGSKLLESNAVFNRQMKMLDEIVQAETGLSVLAELYHPDNKLSDPFISLKYTHPAIFMVEYSMVKVLEAQGILPDYLLGTSLGEFTAAAVSGIVTPEEALRHIIKQAGIIELNCKQGRLLAILSELDVYHRNAPLNTNAVIASYNAPAQFVVAGDMEKMAAVKTFLKEHDVLHQELTVAYGFHSDAIDTAADAYMAYLRQQKFATPSIPVISGVTGQLLHRLPDNYYWDVVRQPTLFTKAIETIEHTIAPGEELIYIDLGPAGSLANLIKYNVAPGTASKGFQVMSPFQQELKKMDELKKYYDERKPISAIPGPLSDQPLLAYVFPGQGSQKKGMGAELFDCFPKLTDLASEVLGYSIKELCLENPDRNLNLTQFTQPALYVVNALSYLKLKEDAGILPNFLAGHSLGEYNALFAAGVFDFETGLELVRKRGELMAKMKDGGMAAIKGLSAEEIIRVIEQHGLEEIDLANYNSQNQIVVSGPRELIAKSGAPFEAAGASLYFPLNVSGAFHSRYMMPAREEFNLFLAPFSFFNPQIPVVSNVEASFYPGNKVRALLADQLIKPVKWTNSIRFLVEQGTITFKEVGPGDVLTKLIWRIQQDLQEPVL
jgi:trans-AT polyketide synthase, acyltransferase and oxidoreductase domains